MCCAAHKPGRQGSDAPPKLPAPDTFQWSPFQRGTDYFEPATKEFMRNYRVQNIEGLVEQLRACSITRFDYGKFVHILDADYLRQLPILPPAPGPVSGLPPQSGGPSVILGKE
ncbi:hypothetical protein LGH70_02285 [Hymenobacter sp. BT635]|uniref:Uncharacterized protein n=1 Tax=Hymenobacter nitidus TaxID=2880929 RepID=A0ABS8A7L0_9BACT|nr:hypothetical protein [Hymenobacter nitidus]MCB2376391.1 hypothetical protein [Hymenobacter nitidus]